MDYFDAYSELQQSLNAYVARHGMLPTRVIMSPYLYQWFRQILREEAELKGEDFSTIPPTELHTDYGILHIELDESLSKWEIIVE